uniref:UBA/THIF-type NAD/FAD binding protein (MOCS3, UBA4, moeB) n=1 Tax=uncultured marine group II/III euryarchaeote SAT1000_38_B01 TaxID=1456579 RepID=A0A075I7Q8_9EURY|nr:UBA/THIF-type NAD/FAD binding protein (MOCS3, UBA4, moeB) [uncultured marine group II/III euryarchaeote SAT1000_38_B01]
MLNDRDKEVFSRQITLPEVGEKGQEELEDTGILIVGMGGLGCPVAHYLISSGIGYLTIMDPDKVELSNLSRQPLYTEDDVGTLKVKAAKQVLSHMNPNAVINDVAEELTKDNALTHVSAHDFVIDCTDNVDSRYVLSDICQSIDKPLIHGGIRAFEGNVGVFLAGSGYYRALYPKPPSPESVQDCSTTGVLSTFVGWVGMHQAMLAVQLALNLIKESSFYFMDGRKGTVRQVEVPDAVVEAQKELPKKLPDHMSASELKERLQSDNPPLLIDVRGPAERAEVRIEAEDIHIPMDVFAQRLGGIPRHGNVVLYCHLGIRSNSARAWVESQGIAISHLSGGIEAWLFENVDESGSPVELANKMESDDSEPEKALTLEELNAQTLANAKMEAELKKIKTESQHSELEGLVALKDKLLQQSLEVEKQQQEHELKLEKMKISAAAKKSNTKFLVEAVYLVYNDGRLLGHVFSEEQQTDAEILTSMLMAVNDFVADSLGATGNIGNLEFGANSIVIEKGEHSYMVSMNYGEPSDSLRQGLRKQLTVIEDKYLNKLEKWDGDVSAFEGCTSNLVKVLLESTVKERSDVA